MDIRYTPRPDITRETEVECLANVYAALLRFHENRKATETGEHDDGEEAADHARAEESGPEKRES